MKALFRVILSVILMITVFAGANAQTVVIKPNDTVKVTCEEESAVTGTYKVTNDGLILMPFIGAIKISGLTAKEAEAKISDELVRQRIVKTATVRVDLKASSKAPIRVGGAVKNFGDFDWKDGMRLSDVVKWAQPTQAADLTKVKIQAANGDLITINYTLFDGKDNKYNPEIRSGDVITFALASGTDSVYIVGGVNKPGAIDFRQGLNLRQAIDKVGGFLLDADQTKIIIESMDKSKREAVMPRDGEFKLKSGDRITVKMLSRGETIYITGGVKTPGLIPYTSGMSLTKAITMAGGLAPGVKGNKVKVIRTTNGKTGSKTYDVKAISEGYQGDIGLLVGDRVEVDMPSKSRKDSGLIRVGIGLALLLLFGFGG